MIFRYEKELVEELVTLLKNKFNIKYIAKELKSGNNIADIVYMDEVERDYLLFEDYTQSYYYVNKIFDKKNIDLNKITFTNKNLEKKFNEFLKKLSDTGYINVLNNKVEIIKRIDFAFKKVVAIEAKLSDWRKGLEQAKLYKSYSDYSYVAIDKSFYKNVKKEDFINNNIGLILVDKGKVEYVIKPRKEKCTKRDIKYYILDKLLLFLKQNKLVIE